MCMYLHVSAIVSQCLDVSAGIWHYYLLVSCHYVYVCVAITRQLRQKILSMKLRYVLYLHVSACII